MEGVASVTVDLMCTLIGRGGREGAVELCRGCSGTGTQIRVQHLLPGLIQQMQTICHECQGQGERINPRDRCRSCQGRKIVREQKVLDVHIDAGIVICDILSAAYISCRIVTALHDNMHCTHTSNYLF